MNSGADAVPTADHIFGPRSFDHDTRCGRSFGPLDQAEWQISTKTVTLMCGEERPGLGRQMLLRCLPLQIHTTLAPAEPSR